MSDTLDLAAIEARCNAATPGPWRVGWVAGRCTLPHVHGVGDCDYRVSWWDEEQLHDITRDVPVGAPYDDAVKVCGNYNVESGGVVHECDAAFIAHAREDIPALIARVRELEQRLEDYRIGHTPVEISRDMWRAECRKAEARVRELEAKLADTVKAHNDVFNLWETASGEAAAAEEKVRELEAKQDQMLKAAVVGATAVERARCVGVFEEMVNLYPDLETFRREIEEGR